jgi:hypothetical protein
MARNQRLIRGAAAVVVVLGAVALGMAPPASARTGWNIVTDCSGDLVLDGAAQPGDQIIVTLLPACGSGGDFGNINARVSPDYDSIVGLSSGFLAIPSSIDNSRASGPDAFSDVTGDDWFAYGSGNSDPTVITTALLAADGAGNPLVPGTIVAVLDPAGFGQFALLYGSAAPATSPIPPWVQSYGRPNADAPCDAGWGASWEMWPTGGQGGYVCTREIPSLG